MPGVRYHGSGGVRRADATLDQEDNKRDEPAGNLRGEDIRIAAASLRAYVDMAPSNQPFAEDEDRNKAEEESQQQRNKVGLKVRVLPLLEMLDAAYAKDVDVTWR